MSDVRPQVPTVTAEQIEEMRHALGLGRKKRPYRNYFYTSAKCSKWNDLIEKGLAKKRIGWQMTARTTY